MTQARVRALAMGPGVVILCGRFEGIDERVIAARGLEEVCVGDVVLAGGEVAAQLLLEATLRLRPGVLGAAESLTEESFEDGLLGGDHAKIDAWRQRERETATRARRPDLWGKRGG